MRRDHDHWIHWAVVVLFLLGSLIAFVWWEESSRSPSRVTALHDDALAEPAAQSRGIDADQLKPVDQPESAEGDGSPRLSGRLDLGEGLGNGRGHDELIVAGIALLQDGTALPGLIIRALHPAAPYGKVDPSLVFGDGYSRKDGQFEIAFNDAGIESGSFILRQRSSSHLGQSSKVYSTADRTRLKYVPPGNALLVTVFEQNGEVAVRATVQAFYLEQPGGEALVSLGRGAITDSEGKAMIYVRNCELVSLHAFAKRTVGEGGAVAVAEREVALLLGGHGQEVTLVLAKLEGKGRLRVHVNDQQGAAVHEFIVVIDPENSKQPSLRFDSRTLGPTGVIDNLPSGRVTVSLDQRFGRPFLMYATQEVEEQEVVLDSQGIQEISFEVEIRPRLTLDLRREGLDGPALEVRYRYIGTGEDNWITRVGLWSFLDSGLVQRTVAPNTSGMYYTDPLLPGTIQLEVLRYGSNQVLFTRRIMLSLGSPPTLVVSLP